MRHWLGQEFQGNRWKRPSRRICRVFRVRQHCMVHTSLDLKGWQTQAGNSDARNSIDEGPLASRPFSGEFSLWSWNARGLFCGDPCKARDKQDK
eukprot:3095910-Karenia_brevis.AAC.1